MADRRPWAKIDTGYALNPKWFQVERYIRSAMPNAMRIALRNAMRSAREAHLFSILYCAQNVTDGMFPVDTIKALATVQTDEEEAAITALFEVGLWINHPGGMAEVRDYLEHQESSQKVKARSQAGLAGATARWSKNANGNAGGNAIRNANRNANGNANRNAEEKRREEKEVRPKTRQRATPLPDNWEPKDRHHTKAKDEHLNLETEAEKFKNYALANGTKYVQWDRAFDNWLLKAKEFKTPYTTDPQAERRKRVPTV